MIQNTKVLVLTDRSFPIDETFIINGSPIFSSDYSFETKNLLGLLYFLSNMNSVSLIDSVRVLEVEENEFMYLKRRI